MKFNSETSSALSANFSSFAHDVSDTSLPWLSANMSDIRKFCQVTPKQSQGGGDSEKIVRQNEKRRINQKVYDKCKRQRTVQETWLKDYDWAVYDTNENELYCGVCRKYPSLHDRDSSLVKGIKGKYRKETLKFHSKSIKHVKCVEHDLIKTQAGPSQLAQAVRKAKEKNSEVYEKLFNTAYYIALEGEPMTKFSSLCDLQEKNGLNLGSNYRNNHACGNFVSSISETLKTDCVTDLEKVRFFSILSDGSTDKSIAEQELVYIRYVDPSGKVNTKLADIVALDHGHAQGVKNGVFQALDTIGLPLELVAQKLVGINTDGASVNLGSKAGAV